MFASALLIYFLVSKATNKLEKSLKREKSMKTLLTQDMLTKLQVSTGYIQLLEEMDLSRDEKTYLRRALDENLIALDLIEDVRKISESDEVYEDSVEIISLVKKAIDENQQFLKNVNTQVEEDLVDLLVKGDDGLKSLFANLLKISVLNQKSSRIRVSFGEDGSNRVVRIENDGKKIPSEIKNQIRDGDVYTGETAGVGGLRFYIISRLLNIYDASMNISRSYVGGIKYEVVLSKG
ncbi:MAG: hypothetical protein ACOCTK_00840 [Candidatus Saliniplasma sp.]